MFYSCLYRQFWFPGVTSDVNGEVAAWDGRRRAQGETPAPAQKVMNPGFETYSSPPFWDTFRTQLVLLDILQPDVSNNIIKSLIVNGERSDSCQLHFMAISVRLSLPVRIYAALRTTTYRRPTSLCSTTRTLQPVTVSGCKATQCEVFGTRFCSGSKYSESCYRNRIYGRNYQNTRICLFRLLNRIDGQRAWRHGNLQCDDEAKQEL